MKWRGILPSKGAQMTLTKAELADMLFEKVGLNKREAKDMGATFNCATSRSGPGATPRPAKKFPSRRGAWSRSTQARSSRRWSSRPMESKATKDSLPPIPAKRYFTIGEVSELCGVKSHV